MVQREKINVPSDKRAWSPSPLIGQVVLVTTLNEDGQSNLATKSWISMMAFDPPLVALGCNLTHWTARNILPDKQFVVNVPGVELVDTAWQIHTLPHPRPVEAVGLTPVPAQKVKPPLVEECKAHLECMLVEHLAFGDEVILLGEIIAVGVDKEALESSDPYQYFKPFVFLENRIYGVIEKGAKLEDRE